MCAAYQKRMHPEYVFSHVTAAQLFAFRVCSPSLLWAQLASVLDLHDLVALGDAIVTSMPRTGLFDNPVLATIDGLPTTTALHAGRRGAKAMTAAIRDIRIGPLSRPESLLRLILVRAGIPEPQMNAAVADEHGRNVAIADLSWPQFRVLIEYEGDYHRRSTSKFRSDVKRGERYADANWFQIRAYADDVFADPESFVARVRRRLVAQGWRPERRERGQIAAARP